MLAYVSSDHAQIAHPYGVLIIFVAGLFMALLFAVLGYYSIHTRLRRWTGSTAAFYSGGINWRTFQDERDPHLWCLHPAILHALLWLSLCAFIFGAGYGICQVWQLPNL